MFKILDPCRKKTWAEMPGDERSRFCDICGHQVHAIERYSRAEQQALISRSPKLCTMLKTEPFPLPSRRSLFTLSLLSMFRPVAAQTGSVELHIVVDATKAPLPDAQISVFGSNGQTFFKGVSDSNGKASLSGLPIGEKLLLVVDAPGFGRWWKRMALQTELESAITVEMREPILIGTTSMTLTRKPWWRRLFR